MRINDKIFQTTVKCKHSQKLEKENTMDFQMAYQRKLYNNPKPIPAR